MIYGPGKLTVDYQQYTGGGSTIMVTYVIWTCKMIPPDYVDTRVIIDNRDPPNIATMR